MCQRLVIKDKSLSKELTVEIEDTATDGLDCDWLSTKYN